jgi:hypothetical protein
MFAQNSFIFLFSLFFVFLAFIQLIYIFLFVPFMIEIFFLFSLEIQSLSPFRTNNNRKRLRVGEREKDQSIESLLAPHVQGDCEELKATELV